VRRRFEKFLSEHGPRGPPGPLVFYCTRDPNVDYALKESIGEALLEELLLGLSGPDLSLKTTALNQNADKIAMH